MFVPVYKTFIYFGNSLYRTNSNCIICGESPSCGPPSYPDPSALGLTDIPVDVVTGNVQKKTVFNMI